MLDSEVARLAGVDRQFVRHWAMRAGINAAKARMAWLRMAWRLKLKRLGEANLESWAPFVISRVNREKGEGSGKGAAPCHAASGR
jgi:hypothetical protein